MERHLHHKNRLENVSRHQSQLFSIPSAPCPRFSNNFVSSVVSSNQGNFRNLGTNDNTIFPQRPMNQTSSISPNFNSSHGQITNIVATHSYSVPPPPLIRRVEANTFVDNFDKGGNNFLLSSDSNSTLQAYSPFQQNAICVQSSVSAVAPIFQRGNNSLERPFRPPPMFGILPHSTSSQHRNGNYCPEVYKTGDTSPHVGDLFTRKMLAKCNLPSICPGSISMPASMHTQNHGNVCDIKHAVQFEGTFINKHPITNAKINPSYIIPSHEVNFASVNEQSSNISTQDIVNKWLTERGKTRADNTVLHLCEGKPGNGSVMRDGVTRKNSKIFQSRNIFRKMLLSLAAVQGRLAELEEEKQTADDSQWDDCVKEVNDLKEAYLSSKHIFQDGELSDLKTMLLFRKKKRERKKCLRQRQDERQHQILFERANNHVMIDEWQKKVHQENIRQQQVKNIKELADKTLSKVRQELKEAGKMLETLSQLKKLRNVRMDTAEKRGQTFPASVSEYFVKKVGNLSRMLTEQLTSYENEEVILKSILESENEEAKKLEERKRAKVEKEKKVLVMENEMLCLFGNSGLVPSDNPMYQYTRYYEQARHDPQAFRSIRRDWDTYLVPGDNAVASRVPDGWVEAEPPSSVIWASALKTSSKCNVDNKRT